MMGNCKLAWLLVVFVSTILVGVVAECPDSAPVGRDGDKYHWPTQPRTIEDFMYREWWFFTLFDQKQDFAMVFAYALSDPSGKFDLDHAGVAAMVWPDVLANKGAGEYNVVDAYKFNEFKGSNDSADMYIGDHESNSITVIDDLTYYTVGTSKDGKTKWWLTYSRQAYPMPEVFNIGDIADLDWISYMPTAKVSGVVQINGKNLTFKDAVGYHDHNYGSWPDPLFNWIWVNYGETSPEGSFAFVCGAYKIPVLKTDAGYLFFRYGEERHKLGTLCGDSFDYKVLKYNTTDTGKKFAVHSQISTASDKWRLEIDFEVQVASINPGGYGLGLKVWECLSMYKVDLYKASADNPDKTPHVVGDDWSLVKHFEGFGFNEWSDLLI